jgi:hypothetical protein
LVEAVYGYIASVSGMLATPMRERALGITRLAYRCVGGVVGLVNHDLD